MAAASAMSYGRAPTPASPAADEARKWSCSVCSSRKVKCDRKDPCFHCVQRGDECFYTAPAPPRRRKRKAVDVELPERLELHGHHSIASAEHADPRPWAGSRGRGDSIASAARIEHGQSSSGVQMKPTDSRVAVMISQGGESRYLENNLWLALGDEIHNDDELVDQAQVKSDDAPEKDPATMILGPSLADPLSLKSVWGRPEELDALLQAFIENVDPLTKVLHIPSLNKLHQQRCYGTAPRDNAIEALLLSVYLSGVVSLHFMGAEQRVNGVLTAELQQMYFGLCRQALLRAEFLKSSSICVLQAYVLYLVSLWATEVLDPYSFFAMSGVAVRNGQRLGVHRDGSILGLSAYETEMRRRLWWQIVFVDVRAAELSGAGSASVAGQRMDAKPPSNINDCDIDPQTREPPAPRQGVTEMMFPLARCTVAEFLKRREETAPFGGSWQKFVDQSMSESDKVQATRALEEELEERFLRYCDPLNPVHVLVSILVRSVLARVTLMTHNPRQFLERGEPVPQEQRDLLFMTSLRIIEYDNLCRTLPSLRKFAWHLRSQLQWHGIIFLLSELRYRTEGLDVDKAWAELQGVFESRQNFIQKESDSLHRAVIVFCKKAWQAREDHALAQQKAPIDRPQFVQEIYAAASRQARAGTRYLAQSGTDPSSAEVSSDFASTSPDVTGSLVDMTSLSESSTPFDHLTMDWTDWDTVMREFAA